MTHALDKSLVAVRFTRMEAELGPAADSEHAGNLEVNANLGLEKLSDGKHMATVKMDVKGVPRNASENDFAFRISITGVGLWQWAEGKMPSDETLKKDSTLYELCNSVHTLVVAEVTRIALGLGFPGVTPSWNVAPEPDLVPPKKASSAASKAKKPRRPLAMK